MSGKKAQARQRAQAEREEQARRERNRERMLRFGISAAVLLVVAVVAVVLLNRSEPTGTGAVPDGVDAAGDGVVVGDESAPVTIDYWFDFQCPYCGQFEQEKGHVLEELVVDGTARVVYHPVAFLGDESDRAANAFGCATDAGRAVEYLRELFAHQPAESSGGYPEEDLLAHGRAVGLAGEQFQTCVIEGTYGDWGASVAEAMRDAGYGGTPAVVVDGEQLDDPVGLSAEEFRARVEQAVTSS